MIWCERIKISLARRRKRSEAQNCPVEFKVWLLQDAAIAAAQASEGNMKALQRQHELEMKETMDTCRVLRAENDRLREQCQSVSNDAHKSSFDLSRKLGAEHKALMLAKQQAGENTGKSVAELTKQRKATQLAQIVSTVCDVTGVTHCSMAHRKGTRSWLHTTPPARSLSRSRISLYVPSF